MVELTLAQLRLVYGITVVRQGVSNFHNILTNHFTGFKIRGQVREECSWTSAALLEGVELGAGRQPDCGWSRDLKREKRRG